MSDRTLVAVTRDGRLRLRATVTDETVTEALIRHLPGELASLALGRALTSTALFPVTWKDCERVSLQWSGRGPLGTLMTELRRPGRLRGLVSQPRAELAKEGYTGWRGIGYGLLPAGYLGVIRQKESGQFSRGQVELANGEVDEDLEAFFLTSEQVPTRLRTAVELGDHALSARAVGVLVQALPGSEGDEAALPDRRLHERMSADDSPERLLEIASGGVSLDVLEEIPVSWACTCTRERIEDGIALLEASEITSMIEEDGGASVTCDFCATIYALTVEDLRAILARKQTPE